MAGVTQRTVYRLRERVDQKLGRLPLAYFDRESRGDILSAASPTTSTTSARRSSRA